LIKISLKTLSIVQERVS